MSEPMTEEKLLEIRSCRRWTASEERDLLNETERARASEATLTARLCARDEALRVAREKVEQALEATSPPYPEIRDVPDLLTAALAAIEEAGKCALTD